MLPYNIPLYMACSFQQSWLLRLISMTSTVGVAIHSHRGELQSAMVNDRRSGSRLLWITPVQIHSTAGNRSCSLGSLMEDKRNVPISKYPKRSHMLLIFITFPSVVHSVGSM